MHQLLSRNTTWGLCVQRYWPLSSPLHTDIHPPLSQRNITRRHNNPTGHHRPGLYFLLIIITSRRIFPRRHRHSLHPFLRPIYTILCWQNPSPIHHCNCLQLCNGKFYQPPLYYSEEWNQWKVNWTQKYWEPTVMCIGSDQEMCCKPTTTWRQQSHSTGGSIQKLKMVYN